MAKTKKEIDKELMYKKLMPSSPKSAKSTAQDDTQEPPSYMQNVHTEVEESFNQHHTVVRREVGVPAMDAQSTVLVNAMEAIVLEKLDSALAKFKCCKCDRCKKDIAAMALNKLSPKYMVLPSGQPTPDIDNQTNTEVVTALIQAVLAVRAHPRH